MTKLKINYEKQARTDGSKIGQGASDSWLWFKTRSALATTDDLRDSTINFDVENSVVTFKGTVAGKAQKEKAVEIAKNIDGVKQVRDLLKIQLNNSLNVKE